MSWFIQMSQVYHSSINKLDSVKTYYLMKKVLQLSCFLILVLKWIAFFLADKTMCFNNYCSRVQSKQVISSPLSLAKCWQYNFANLYHYLDINRVAWQILFNNFFVIVIVMRLSIFSWIKIKEWNVNQKLPLPVFNKGVIPLACHCCKTDI